MTSLVFFGSWPELSCAELASQYPKAKTTLVGDVALVENDTPLTLKRLTGSTKIATLINTSAVADLTPEFFVDWMVHNTRGSGKLTFAISCFGERWSQAKRLPLECKRLLREHLDRSVRWFADNEGYTSPAAVHKLGLIEDGYDFSIIIKDRMAHVAVTAEVQNPDLWTKIDMLRPRRNAKNGMLPPKLAEILVHLAGSERKTLFDPFCGSGTLLEAAARAGIPQIYGFDVLPLIIEDAQQNLAWAKEEDLIPRDTAFDLRVADATVTPDVPAGSIDAIVTEGYLGQPLQGNESLPFLETERHTVETLWKKSLVHWANILAPDGVIIAIWPEYKTERAQTRVDIDDATLANCGLVREPFALAGQSSQLDLTYARAEQFIRRRIVKLRKI